MASAFVVAALAVAQVKEWQSDWALTSERVLRGASANPKQQLVGRTF